MDLDRGKERKGNEVRTTRGISGEKRREKQDWCGERGRGDGRAQRVDRLVSRKGQGSGSREDRRARIDWLQGRGGGRG